jgi:hypothetical protein
MSSLPISAGASAHIPHAAYNTSTTSPQHLPPQSSSTTLPRLPTRTPHAAITVTDVTDQLHCDQHADPITRRLARLPLLLRSTSSTSDKVADHSRTVAPSVKSRAHSRLASLGRIRSRGSVFQQTPTERQPSLPSIPSQAYSTQQPPTLPSRIPSHTPSHKRSKTSVLSRTSSETLTEDAKSDDIKSIDERSPQLDAFTPNNKSNEHLLPTDEKLDLEEQYQNLIHKKSQTMHQTSSRLLRMTEGERPFTRVCITPHPTCYPLLVCCDRVSLHIGFTAGMEPFKLLKCMQKYDFKASPMDARQTWCGRYLHVTPLQF